MLPSPLLPSRWLASQLPFANRPSCPLQNLEMHDRIEHLIEKQVSRGGHSSRARSKSEYVSR